MNTAGVKAKEHILNFIHIIFQARCNGFCLELDDGCDDIVVKREQTSGFCIHVRSFSEESLIACIDTTLQQSLSKQIHIIRPA